MKRVHAAGPQPGRRWIRVCMRARARATSVACADRMRLTYGGETERVKVAAHVPSSTLIDESGIDVCVVCAMVCALHTDSEARPSRKGACGGVPFRPCCVTCVEYPMRDVCVASLVPRRAAWAACAHPVSRIPSAVPRFRAAHTTCSLHGNKGRRWTPGVRWHMRRGVCTQWRQDTARAHRERVVSARRERERTKGRGVRADARRSTRARHGVLRIATRGRGRCSPRRKS